MASVSFSFLLHWCIQIRSLLISLCHQLIYSHTKLQPNVSEQSVEFPVLIFWFCRTHFLHVADFQSQDLLQGLNLPRIHCTISDSETFSSVFWDAACFGTAAVHVTVLITASSPHHVSLTEHLQFKTLRHWDWTPINSLIKRLKCVFNCSDDHKWL